MINKIVTYDNLKPLFHDGMTLMVSGFLGCGAPEGLISFIITNGWKGITLIVNDTAFPHKGAGRLIAAGNEVITKVICVHIGTNPVSKQRHSDGSLEVIFYPQGTLIEMIRAKGAGLGGILTPTAVGTEYAQGKQTVVVNDQQYLLEPPLGAEVALIKADTADMFGNCTYHATACNYNPIMATAGEKVILETSRVVEVGELHKDHIHTPGVFVDYIVQEKR